MKITPTSKNKRILILNYEFPPLGGGAGNATKYILKEFSKIKNFKIDLITSSIGTFKKEQFSKNITVYYLNIGKKNSNIHFQSIKDLCIYSIKAFFFAKKLMSTKSYDLIHSFFGIPCGYIAMKLKIPYIVSLRGSDVPTYNKRFYWLDKLIFKRLSKKIWQTANAVIANSENLKKIALNTSPKQKIEIIPNGVDIEEFKPSEKSNTGLRIISTSRLIERKGIEDIIIGFIKFHQHAPDSELIIVGDGNLKEKLIAIVKQNKLINKIHFLGNLDHSQLPQLYKESDVFISASLNEGMSNSLLEAMASGLGIICTDTGGTKELIKRENGVIVNKNSPDDIAKALITLYKNRTLLNQMKINNCKHIKQFSWTTTAKIYLEIYKSITNQKS